MNTILSATGLLEIANFPLNCQGSYSAGEWLIDATWQAGAGQSISVTSLVTQIIPGFSFDPGNLLPTVNFTALQVSFNPNVKSTFSCTANIDWNQPFGIPIGLGIHNLNFWLQKQPNTPLQIKADGNVTVNNVGAHVAVYFTGGSPDFILVNAIPTLSLSGIVKQFFGSGASIPGNFIDLSLAGNQIYYLAQSATVPAGIIIPSPQQGLNIASQCTLTLAGYQFPAVDINVNVASGNGVSVSGTFENSISIAGFLTLTGANAGYTNGPSLNISTKNNSKTFGLDCGLQFLGKNFGTAGMTITNQNGQTVLNATLSYNGTLGPFTNPSLSMQYKDAHFSITNWPGVSAANLAIDFAKTLKDINSAQGCGKILDLVLNKTVETNFTISPDFTTKKPNVPGVADGQFYIVLTGFYTISAAGTVVCSLDLPTLALSFKTPSDFSFDSIMSLIGQTIVDNAVSVVQQLVNNQKALAQFILVFAGKAAASKIADQICDKLLSAALDTFLAGVGSVAGDVLGALGAAAGALVGMGCGSSSGGSGGGSGGGSNPGISPLPTSQIQTSVLNGDNWTITWGAVGGTNYYQVIITDSSNKCIDVQYVAVTTATIQLPAAFVNAPYVCQVVAWANPGMNYNSAAASIILSQLGQPAAATMSVDYKTGVLTCVFAPVANATGYTTALYDSSGTQLAQTTTFTIDNGNVNAVFTIKNLSPVPKQYTIGITATGGTQYIPGNQWMSPVQQLNWGIGYTDIGGTFNVS